jgi:hypothetical protein
MGAIKMFHAVWLGIEAFTIYFVRKKNHQALDIGRGMEKKTSRPKHNFLGLSTMNMSPGQ